MILKTFNNINLKTKITISISVIIIILFLVIYLAIIPATRDIINIKDDIQAQKIDLEKKYLKGQNLKNLKKKIELIEEKMDIIDKAYIPHEDKLKFVTILEKIAEENKINQKMSFPSVDNPSGNYYNVPLVVSAQGAVANQMNYLIDLESLPYYINITDLEISASNLKTVSADGKEIKNINILLKGDSNWKK